MTTKINVNGKEEKVIDLAGLRKLDRILQIMNKDYVKPNQWIPPRVYSCKDQYIVLNPKMVGAPNNHFAALALDTTYKYRIRYNVANPSAMVFYNPDEEFDHDKIYIAKVKKGVIFSDMKPGYIVDTIDAIDIDDPNLATIITIFNYSNLFVTDSDTRKLVTFPKLNKVAATCLGDMYNARDCYVSHIAARLVTEFYIYCAESGLANCYEHTVDFIHNPYVYPGMNNYTKTVKKFIGMSYYSPTKISMDNSMKFIRDLSYSDIRDILAKRFDDADERIVLIKHCIRSYQNIDMINSQIDEEGELYLDEY